MVVDESKLSVDDFRAKFSEERSSISSKVDEYINRLVDVKEFVNCDTFFHSKRQAIVESTHMYMDYMLVMQMQLNKTKAGMLDTIVNDTHTNFQLRTKEERFTMIDGSSSVVKLQEIVNLFNNQIMFLNESKKTIEGIIFNMKYRFEVQKYLGVC